MPLLEILNGNPTTNILKINEKVIQRKEITNQNLPKKDLKPNNKVNDIKMIDNEKKSKYILF